ncbi:dihydrofolate reductase [Aureimonas mangrovi]|uniref:dihydrofolate reductase n=1 Tax=Aureimonas mangrovi TaxID=2758041 RepID=UPI00163D7D26|nr:dihydrofolate reductase [Aureimonas mangrovi]
MYVLNEETFTVVAVVAAARNGVIGREGEMPWKLPSDLKRYRALTMGRPMIMGRKTLESIGRVLDGRDTIVVTRSGTPPIDGALAAGSMDEAMSIAASCARARGTNEIVIAGGGEIYRAFMAFIDRVEMTRVEIDPQGDTSFPELDSNQWKTTSDVAMSRGDKDSADARFLSFVRTATEKAP